MQEVTGSTPVFSTDQAQMTLRELEIRKTAKPRLSGFLFSKAPMPQGMAEAMSFAFAGREIVRSSKATPAYRPGKTAWADFLF
jgi:hypothetical protein